MADNKSNLGCWAELLEYRVPHLPFNKNPLLWMIRACITHTQLVVVYTGTWTHDLCSVSRTPVLLVYREDGGTTHHQTEKALDHSTIWG